MTRIAENSAAAPGHPAAPGGIAVRVDSLTHAYGEHVALHGISFEVRAGEIFGLLGPNGGGKTTLFRILSTLIQPRSGTAQVLGADILTERAQVRAHLGVVFQAPALDRKLTVRENLTHQGHLYGLRGADLGRRIDAALARFRLSDRRDALVEGLSGGLRRRVEIAKGLLHRPRILILDEPSTGLDPGARRDLWQLLQEIQSTDQVTILMTSHILEEVERCDRVAILDKGRIVAVGTPKELKERVGGDVISVTGADPRRLAGAITERFGLPAAVVDGVVRLDRDANADLVRRLLEAFPGDIDAVTLSKPTLEDVFIQSTGHTFWTADAPEEKP